MQRIRFANSGVGRRVSFSIQRGVTFLGLLATAIVIGVVALICLQVVPTALEYQSVLKAANKAARDGSSVAEVRASFDRSAAIDDISSISGRDLQVYKENERVVVSFAYDRQIHLIGPAWLLLKYSGRSSQ